MDDGLLLGLRGHYHTVFYSAWEPRALSSQVQRSADDRPCRQVRYLSGRRLTPGNLFYSGARL